METRVCAACLSERRTAPLRNLLHVFTALLDDVSFEEDTAVCWECEGLLRRCLRFQARARQAQRLLGEQSLDLNRIPTLSSLVTSTNHDYDFTMIENSANCNTYSPIPDHDYSALEDNTIVTPKISGFMDGMKELCKYNEIKQISSVPEGVKLKKIKPKAWLHIKSGETIQKVPVFNDDIGKALRGVGVKASTEIQKRKEIENEGEREDTKLVIKKEGKTSLVGSTKKKKKIKSLKVLKEQFKKQKKIDCLKTNNVLFKTVRMSEMELQSAREEERQKTQYDTSAHKCTTCIIGYYDEAQLDDHNKYKHTPKAGHEQCNICSVYVKEEALEVHRDNHYTLFECRSCPYRHVRSSYMWRHTRRAHTACCTYFPCKQCDAVFTSSSKRRYHAATKHVNPEPANCEYCGKSYRSLETLRIHIKNTHRNRARVPCATCGRTYLGEANMRAHVRLAHRAGADRPVCQQCCITFKNMETYKTHLKTSRNHVAPEKMKFVCTACDKRFAVKRSLQDHYDSAHLSKVNACQQCDRVYTSLRSLRAHERSAHLDLERVRDKVCEHCGKAFHSAKALRVHMAVHSDRRPYACNLCQATFRFNSALYNHMQIKHQAKNDDMKVVEAEFLNHE